MRRSVALPSGERVPALGQGTWRMGETPRLRADEIAALRKGIDLGLTLIDTAEMYGEGDTEDLVGEALAGLRDDVFLVSKVYPHNASRAGVVAACERSLARLRTDRLDLYLLHWPGAIPLAETVAGCEDLIRAGKIRHWGVSNFDVEDMESLMAVPGGEACAVNQILYNPVRRGPEYALLPWLAERTIPVMAYSPVEQGRLPRAEALTTVGRRHGVEPYAVALSWVMRAGDVVAIPKAVRPHHLAVARSSLDVVLDAEDLALLDAAFPPPTRKRPLDML